MNDPKRLGAQIATQRKHKKLSQGAIGRQGTVSAIENGENVQLFTWLNALDALGLEVQLIPRPTDAPRHPLNRAHVTQVRKHVTTIDVRAAAGLTARVSKRTIEEKIKQARRHNSSEPSAVLKARRIKD